ncbi:MAG: B12-binding domain-containing radical SAM protein [Spirochaetota bacterium]
MSNLGFHNLFHHVSSFNGIQAHRFFIEHKERLFSPDAPGTYFVKNREGINLSGYDVVFFSVSFEIGYINMIKMLLLSSIPPVRKDRGAGHPLIIAGGIAVTANPSFLSGLCDVVYIGDMECSLNKMLEILFHHSFKKGNEVFREVEELEGVWVPEFSEEVLPRRAVWPLKGEPAHSVIITKKTEFSGMFLVEIARGCRNLCRFCMTRCVASPFRTFPIDEVLSLVKKAHKRTDKVGLIAPVLSDYGELSSLVRMINGMGIGVSFSSLRADAFTEEIARLVSENSQSTVTFAPETGSAELRRSIGKTFTNEDLLAATELALKHGIRRFRYYFMYGLPGEDISDIRAIVNLVSDSLESISRYRGKLHLSVNPFVPKKGTPFEHHKLYPLTYYGDVQAFLKGALVGLKNLNISFESLRHLQLQYVLSIGGSSAGLLLAESMVRGNLRGFIPAVEDLLKNG